MSAHGGNGSVALRWFDINVATNTLRQSGLIADQELSFYYGSIAVNDFGDVVIGFTGSGPSQFASAYAVEGHTPLVLGVIAGVTIWTTQEWVSATSVWSTQITELSLEPVPELATLLLFGTTAAGLGLARWRQRRRKQQAAAIG
jgi:hypothetical protein